MRKLVLFCAIIFIYSQLYAVNELTVKDNSQHGAKPGYLEKATLVIEPFGSHVEESLYLEYSDRNQFTSNLLEIVHRFELPKDAVIQDMWLWIGDSVMQAKMYDTWSARSVYDSIVAAHYDPAFLAKNGSQYELRVYPLAAGSFRKVKISFIVPTLWYGNQATAELPLKMLLSNNSPQKPLDILFRTKEDIWGTPQIIESPEHEFVPLVDTLDYQFQHIHMEDVSNYSSLNLRFNTQFNDGYFITGYNDQSNYTYFQLGILPDEFFNVSADSTSKEILIAMDFSGSFSKDLYNNLPIYKSLVSNSLKSNDKFKMLISGNESIVDFTETFIEATQQNITGVFEEFKNSDFASAINNNYMPNILFCDSDASINWNYSGLSAIAKIEENANILSSINEITQFDVVAAYRHGHDDPITWFSADQVILRLDSLFAEGGRFLTYFDYNREGKEKLATHYISGLKVKKRVSSAVTLYRNDDGNIGLNFPESFTRNASYFLEFNDPDVKIELMDQSGDAAVISKKIKNGLLVVSGIWSLRDDGAMKTLLGAPLLGVNSNKNPFTLDELLNIIKDEHDLHKFSKVILISDSDSLINISDSKSYIQDYIADFSNDYPRFLTINLLNNDIFTPVYITENQVEYYGSGYFLNELADQSNGTHIEKHLYDWQYITSLFSPYSPPTLTNLNIDITVDEGSGQIFEIREINKFPDPQKPRFFLGKSNAESKMRFDISGRFKNADLDSLNQFEFLVPHDTTTSNKIVSSMLGYEHILDLFGESPIDTSKIVSLSLYHNLLTDFTALLALEPNDSLRFMKDPFDESGLTSVNDENTEKDSTFMSAYPNPFNSQVTLKFQINSPSRITASIYNAVGQKIYDFTDKIYSGGILTMNWNAKNNYSGTVSSGLYIFRAVVADQITQKQKVYTKKLMYLK